MLLVLGDRRFDVRHRAVVIGMVATEVVLADGGPDVEAATALAGAGADALAVPSPAAVAAVCERVAVPVGVRIDRDRVRFGTDAPVSVVAIDDTGPERMARVAGAIVAGGRVLLADSPAAVRSDRRVSVVMGRVLAARTST